VPPAYAGYEIAGVYKIGSIAANHTEILNAGGRFALTTQPGVLSGGSGAIKVGPASSTTTYANSGIAASGEHLRFSVMLADTTFQPALVHLRISDTTNHSITGRNGLGNGATVRTLEHPRDRDGAF
jgi:hypothetical protein